MDQNERVETGVPGLDRVLGDGLRRGALHLIAGAPGTGKTILAHQTGSRHARSGAAVLYLTVLVESHEALLAQARRFEFFDASWVGRLFYYASLYSALAEGGVAGTHEAIEGLIRDHRPALVVLDGLHTIKSAAASDFEFTRLMNELQTVSSLGGTTFLAITNVEREWAASSEFAMSDGIFRLGRERSGRRVIRTIEVEKLRGADPLIGSHVFTISSAGIRIFPRLESVVAKEGLAPRMQAERRLRFGIPGLDAMLGGGISSASATMFAGVPGAGKTLMALSFVAAGAAAGEAGLFVGFHETPDRLLAKAERIGIPLREAVDGDRVRLLWKPSAELLADEVAEEVLDLVREHGIERLVIDGLDDIARMFVTEGRSTAFLAAFMDVLRSRGVSGAFTQEVRTIFGLELRLPMAEVPAAVDNIIFVRYVELRARLRHLISILKVRDQDYDSRIREFQVSARGIEVGEPLAEAEAVLSGLGRLAEPKRGGD